MDAPPHYLAVPKSGSGRGVVVLHSWWGLNTFFKGVCDRLADAGFVALAPDLYSGRVASTEAEARALRAQATASRRVPAYKQLSSAIKYLSRLDSVTNANVSLIGFSMGGHWALWLAQRAELPINATVVFYAARSGDFTQSKSRFLFHFAEVDDWVSTASIKKLKRNMELAGRTASYHVYPGTTHWFFEDDRMAAYNQKAAAASWNRTLEFLRDA